MRLNLQRQVKNRTMPIRMMSKKKQKGNKDGTCPKDNKCGDNQFFGGCFKKEPEFKCSEKKEKPKRCRDPCKDGPCKQGRD
ncbi:uncharacterized protein Dwil_GK16788 [Drosophila willistoni]|uniref:Uncharacterized protein n=2 Tax=Drosophila willistoni TaxID=7260 RepID=B4MLX0_DROWI|nr:uncharacterized protein Dwil_GK16788 [Drosophila willistoni]